MSVDAKMQPARSFVLFVCCLFSDPVIMHTTHHWQQMNVNMGNDRMISNKITVRISSDKFAPAPHQSTCDMWWSRCQWGRFSYKQFSFSISIIPPMLHIHLHQSLMLAITMSLSNKPPYILYEPTLNYNWASMPRSQWLTTWTAARPNWY